MVASLMPRRIEQHHQTHPEHDLLLAVTCVPASSESIDRVLSAPLDWTRVVELALAHRLASPLLVALETADPELVPPELLHALAEYCQRLRLQSHALVTELFELLDALEKRSVMAIPFKGPLLGELLFGDAGLRPPGDLDLLVRHTDVALVREVLEEHGYVDGDQQPGAPPLTDAQRWMYERYQCEYMFVRLHDEMAVEPHWGLSQRPLALDVDYAGMLDRATPTRLGDRTVLTLAPDDLLLALCVHGAKHHWERLAWIRDVAAVLTKWPNLDLEAAVQRARARGCARLLLLSLSVVRECAGVSLPEAIGDAIEADPAIGQLRQEVLEALFQPDRPEPRNDRVEPFRFRLRERWSDRLRYASRTWLTPRRRHVEMVALPYRMRWGYYPLKLGADFAYLLALRAFKRSEAKEVRF